MLNTKIAAVLTTAAIPKVVSVAIIIDYNRFNQKSKAIIFHQIGGDIGYVNC